MTFDDTPLARAAEAAVQVHQPAVLPTWRAAYFVPRSAPVRIALASSRKVPSVPARNAGMGPKYATHPAPLAPCTITGCPAAAAGAGVAAHHPASRNESA